MRKLRIDDKIGQKYFVENGIRVYVGVCVKDRIPGRVYQSLSEEVEIFSKGLRNLQEEFENRERVRKRAVRKSNFYFDTHLVA